MKIAILGGAFDPVHIGHYLVAQQVKEQLNMDQIWLMVCYSYFPEFPTKFKRITPYEQRFAMAKMMESNSIKVSDFEEKHNKPSRTIDTLRLLTEHYPKNEFYWIIGSDALPTFHLWNEWQTIISEYNIVIFPRDTDFKTLEERVKTSFQLRNIPQNITIVEGNLIVSTIASTHIRNRVRSNLSIDHFVDNNVKNFISNTHLYR